MATLPHDPEGITRLAGAELADALGIDRRHLSTIVRTRSVTKGWPVHTWAEPENEHGQIPGYAVPVDAWEAILDGEDGPALGANHPSAPPSDHPSAPSQEPSAPPPDNGPERLRTPFDRPARPSAPPSAPPMPQHEPTAQHYAAAPSRSDYGASYSARSRANTAEEDAADRIARQLERVIEQKDGMIASLQTQLNTKLQEAQTAAIQHQKEINDLRDKLMEQRISSMKEIQEAKEKMKDAEIDAKLAQATSVQPGAWAFLDRHGDRMMDGLMNIGTGLALAVGAVSGEEQPRLNPLEEQEEESSAPIPPISAEEEAARAAQTAFLEGDSQKLAQIMAHVQTIDGFKMREAARMLLPWLLQQPPRAVVDVLLPIADERVLFMLTSMRPEGLTKMAQSNGLLSSDEAPSFLKLVETAQEALSTEPAPTDGDA